MPHVSHYYCDYRYEDNREAIVLALCKRSLGPLLQYAKQRGQGGIIVFCNRKKQAHRLVLLFGLFGELLLTHRALLVVLSLNCSLVGCELLCI